MRVYFDSGTKAPVYITGVCLQGGALAQVDQQAALAAAARVSGLPPQRLSELTLSDLAQAEQAALFFQQGRRKAVLEGDRIVSFQSDPDWTPPSAPIDPMTDLLNRVDKIPVSEHSRRNEEQKEFIKTYGIPWVKANPEATPAQAVTAIMAAVRAEFPDDPIVCLIYDADRQGREDGLLMSYARAAVRIGAMAEPTWEALRALIVGSTPAQLRQVLRNV